MLPSLHTQGLWNKAALYPRRNLPYRPIRGCYAYGGTGNSRLWKFRFYFASGKKGHNRSHRHLKHARCPRKRPLFKQHRKNDVSFPFGSKAITNHSWSNYKIPRPCRRGFNRCGLFIGTEPRHLPWRRRNWSPQGSRPFWWTPRRFCLILKGF